MEPTHNNYGPPTELPQPIEAQSQSGPEQSPPAYQESRPSQMPASGKPAQQPSTTSLPDPLSSVQPVAVNPGPAVSDNTSSALMADDADLIEKEWVIKAKSIVLQTKDDPYNQNREMNKVKADYLKKRYNKDLKVSEN